MIYLLAVGHILGAVVALLALGIGVAYISAWELKRNQRIAVDEMSLALGIPVAALDDSMHSQKVLKFLSDKFSSELLRNRLSDLCGLLRTAWTWLGTLLEVGILLGVIWYTFTDDAENAVHAWWVVAIVFFFWVTGVVFSLVCKLLTGRYPGQAKQARKSLADLNRNPQRAQSLIEE